VAAAALLISPAFPYWKLKLSAPQYPRGLFLAVYPNHVAGDVDEIDGLNHYIGMRKIGTAAERERRIGIPMVVFVAALLMVAAILRSRWPVLLVIPAMVFPLFFLGDLYWWLRDSGLGLDPKAPLSSSIKPFVPQFLGAGKIAQFRTEASLGLGCYLSLFAAGVSLVFGCVRLSLRGTSRSRPRGLALSVGLIGLLAFMAGVMSAGTGSADTVIVGPGGSRRPLADVLAHAASGDTVLVRGGVHAGPLVVGKSVRLIGEGQPVIDGRGQGTVVRLEASSSVLRGFKIRSSGDLLAREDAGVLAAAPDLRIEDNTLEDVLFGIYLRRAPRSVVRGNAIRGKDLPVARRGDLIRLWYSDDARVEANSTAAGRDAVLWYSSNLTVRDNRFAGGRYGLHFMYCHDASVEGNVLCDNSVGAFLMYSRRLRLGRNWIANNRGASGYGIGLKDVDLGMIAGNVVASNKVGFFLEHASAAFEQNLLADNDKGVVIFPSAEGNRFEANSFLENGEQVVMEGFAGTMTSNLWKGNFWSDYRGYDSDGDGRGDLAYRPMRLFERLAERNPVLRLLSESPSARAIDFAARLFPIFEPRPQFADTSPRMQPLPAPLIRASVGDAGHWVGLAALMMLCPLALCVSRPSTAGRARHLVNRPKISADAAAASATPARSVGAAPLPAISVCALTRRFAKVVAVDNLSFDVQPGETIALWGPNGAGKTTVLRCLLGLLSFQGTAQVLGHPCGPRGRASRRQLGYVPQEVRLHADQTVRETVRFYARLRRVTSDRVDRLLEEWGLGDVDRRTVRNLSGGMKQKLALVIALLADPPVLLLDEPTSNLDARSRREFSVLLERLKASGKTLLFCTHQASEVWRLADRVIVLEAGRAIAQGPPEKVRQHLVERGQLSLIVPADRGAGAAARLRDAGFDVRANGSRLCVDLADGRKVEALKLLYQIGVPILDFELENDRAASGGSPEE
jgi:nitrous oxidase accessory protein